jgi:hypothetical protein
MKKNITYLFGAGASAYAIPMMKSLPGSMKYFFEIVKMELSEVDDFKDKLEHNSKVYGKLLNEIERFGTPDIVAKILTYRRDPDGELWRLKNLLSCYMIYQQLEAGKFSDWDVVGNLEKFSSELFSNDEELKKRCVITENLDNRYVEFMSSILTGSGDYLKIPENLNFISWNYDHQLEKALSIFYPQNQYLVQEKFSVFPVTNQSLKFIPVDQIMSKTKNVKILKLNGTGGFGHTSNPAKSIFDFTNQILDSEGWQGVGKLLFDDFSTRPEENQLAFAWEESTVANVAQAISQKKIGESQIVVVIGYSFPNFNREVDRRIFQDFNGDIYIQDPNADEIREKLDGVKAGLKSKSIAVKSAGAFTLPNEFWE